MSFSYLWYGHGTHGLDIDDFHVIVDPFFSDNPAASATRDEVNPDFIVVSHGHGDHIGDTISIAKRTEALVISNFEIINWLGGEGLEKLHPQHIGGGFNHPFGYLKLTQALHGSALPDGAYGGSPAGILVTTLAGEKIYLACDTGLFASMKLIGAEGIDLAVLPIGDNFTMGPDDALRAVQMIKPKHVIPVHFNTWPVIAQDPLAWAARVAAETDTAAHVLQPGDRFSL
jgi:L-ascorbate metabolism protein UlaG (beta-lactamase superfamily)